MLSNLNTLLLDSNSLTGTVPTELGMLSNLYSLFLQDNVLEGSLPSQLGAISDARIVFDRNTNLCGMISFDNYRSSSSWSGTAIGQHCNTSGFHQMSKFRSYSNRHGGRFLFVRTSIRIEASIVHLYYYV
ncbi:hypothetical protein CYMTET_8135 [Cymbomonas tetramitiformis]|uniref:Uncharacterized protein n=1 Tax=Cymbomonas tetramitiformis TaxID=36881 RepID=A0AAE0LGD6_9CHLO|nr:hypothetical protein CYMTET_8135 [Cymbomonas tetramitiformis]